MSLPFQGLPHISHNPLSPTAYWSLVNVNTKAPHHLITYTQRQCVRNTSTEMTSRSLFLSSLDLFCFREDVHLTDRRGKPNRQTAVERLSESELQTTSPPRSITIIIVSASALADCHYVNTLHYTLITGPQRVPHKHITHTLTDTHCVCYTPKKTGISTWVTFPNGQPVLKYFTQFTNNIAVRYIYVTTFEAQHTATMCGGSLETSGISSRDEN